MPTKLADLEFKTISIGSGHVNTSFTSVSDGYSGNPGSTVITIEKNETNPPIISDLKDQTISKGSSFTNIVLDNFVNDFDNQDNELSWTATGQTALAITITNNIAIIQIPNPNWTGSETITFTVIDPKGLTASESVVFIVNPVQPAFWTEPDSDQHINTLSMEQGENKTIRFKAEVPSGKMLKGYKFSIGYNSDIVSFSAIKTPDSAFPPTNVNTSTPDKLIFLGFDFTGVIGPATIGFVDITLTGLQPGSFDITTIVDNFGTDSSFEFQPFPEILHINVHKPQCHTKAEFFYSQEPNNVFVVNFDASTSIGQSYTWNFGDGTTGNGQSITYTYASAGNYPVSLIVSDNSENCKDSIQKTVQVMQPPTITLVPNQSISNGQINVIISSDSGHVEYQLNDQAWKIYSIPLYFTVERHYQIVARLSNDKRFISQPVSFEIDHTPKNLKVIKQKNGSVKLQWDYITGYDTFSYYVYRSEMPNGRFYRVDIGQHGFYSINNEKVYYTDIQLTNGRTYYYKVKSCLNDQESLDFSNMVSATPEKSFEFSCRSIDFESKTIVRNSRMAYVGDSVKYYFQIMPSEKFKGVIEASCNDLPNHVSYAFLFNDQNYGASMHDIILPATFVLNINIGSAALSGEYQFKLLLENVWNNASSNFWEIPLILIIKEKSDSGIFIDISKQPEAPLFDKKRYNAQQISQRIKTRNLIDDMLTYRIRKYESVEIYGEILPKSQQRVHIQLESSDGQFVTSTTAQTDESGKFNISGWLSTFDLNEYKLSAQWTDYMTNTHISQPRKIIIEKGTPLLTCNRPSNMLAQLNKEFTISGNTLPVKTGRVYLSVISPENQMYSFDCDINNDGRYQITRAFFNQRGIWKIKAYWSGDDTFIGCESDFLVVPVDVSTGRAIILGGGEGDIHNILFQLVRKLTSDAYRDFKLRGFSDEMIYYSINSEMVDIDHDEKLDDIVDNKTPSTDSFLSAIENKFALEVNETTPLFIYMFGHGTNDARFIVLGNDEWIEAEQLNQSLNIIQQKTGCVVILILESCFSGAFIESISANRRIILTSTGNSWYQFDSKGEIVFSRFLFGQLKQNKNLKYAYEYSKKQMKNLGYSSPLLDDNGDGLSDENDGEVSLNQYFKGNITMNVTVSIDEDSITMPYLVHSAKSLDISAKVFRGDHETEQVWVQIIPPDTNLSENADLVTFQQSMLSYNQNTHTYEGQLRCLIQAGLYKIVFMASQVNNTLSSPVIQYLTVEKETDPADINNDGQINLIDLILGLKITAGFQIDEDLIVCGMNGFSFGLKDLIRIVSYN